MSKRDGRTSAITGVGDETASALTPEQLALMGYQIPQTRHMVVDALPAGAIVPQGDGTFRAGEFMLTPVGVQIPDGTSADSWSELGDVLLKLNGAIQWLIGDWLNYGNRVWGKTYEDIAEVTGYEVESLYNLASVCAKIPFSLRNENLDFSHHSVVAHIPDSLKGQEFAILEYCEKNRLSVRHLRAYIKSLTPIKKRQIPASTLFTKERAPKLGELRGVYMKARSGDKKAVELLRYSIKQYREWLDEIEHSVGLK
jgi:hypothetical protein